MFDIVVCSSCNDLMKRSIKVINSALISYEFDYHIYRYNQCCYELLKMIVNNKRKLYIIDIDNSLDIAFKIREKDFTSIIILISSHASIDNKIFNERLMILGYVCTDGYYDDKLKQDINLAVKILFKDNVFVFKYNHVIYRIFYEDINYIEKETQIKRCIIHTVDKNYYVVNSIEKLNSILGGTFIKTHQSCIVNLMNVKNIDCVNNLVCFKNGNVTPLITKRMQKVIKEYIE